MVYSSQHCQLTSSRMYQVSQTPPSPQPRPGVTSYRGAMQTLYLTLHIFAHTYPQNRTNIVKANIHSNVKSRKRKTEKTTTICLDAQR